MSDIVAELRRLYEAAPQGEWTCEGPTFHGYRVYTSDEHVWNHTLTEAVETADLIVAMHNHLPALLQAIEAVRASRAYVSTSNSDDTYEGWMKEQKRLLAAERAALAALERSDEG